MESYRATRSQIEDYFDRTAVDAWSKLTSDAPVSRIRATVRAGREAMRDTLLGWLPADLTGARILDAGCGTGMLATEAARRGGDVVAVDLSPNLIRLARERVPQRFESGRVVFQEGDMLDPALGDFDYVVAMDSVIHYNAPDMHEMIVAMTARARHGVLVTFAPRTMLLSLMHATGRLFPRSDRAPQIKPVGDRRLRRMVAADDRLAAWQTGRSARIARGFYISQALELSR
ncbi:magnesium protoporphyrin IX methyltransferase [Salinisphaera sp. Q1T1-3]|uniref:magnesium protoporphyrin IX methyltransferase n=1 Tax=Salinisphaera sp. Q1T1-3 TaxID=2321229 RepID=UPI000E71EBA0|nr:magnesium protoporphyrin IX methyltransferase [Salinisphaera sp. Q1T1-3]RJS92120.1 magnesium protoporphyrin IX methyltransferase [Salinisphaera sp. Q1T1-3]